LETWIGQDAMRSLIGVVVPAYFSAKPSDELVAHLLKMTLGECVGYVRPENTWVVVDGDARTERLVGQLRETQWSEHGATFNVIALPENRGKFWAIKEGITALLHNSSEVSYIVIRDGDGDHDIAEVPSLTRAALHLCETYGHTRVIVLGSDARRYASRLYAALHEADALGVDEIWVLGLGGLGDDPIWGALRERLGRASR